MKYTLTLVLVFLQILVCTLGFVCLPETCKGVQCNPNLKCGLGSELRKDGCACCKTCVKVLGENERCISLFTLPYVNPCGKGLSCVEGICQNVGNLEEILNVKNVLGKNP